MGNIIRASLIMMLALDVLYHEQHAQACGLAFANWQDEKESHSLTLKIDEVNEYIPGEFYRRELPCLLRVIQAIDFTPQVIVIDGYVTLGQEQRPGLGWHLWQSLNERIPVIGVAKTRFHDSSSEGELCRGESSKPLFISAAGIALAQARAHIASMHGQYRIPSLLKRVDQLTRQPVAAS